MALAAYREGQPHETRAGGVLGRGVQPVPPTLNDKPSSSSVGGAQTPPICPVMCQPIGGNVPFSAPTT